uniref:ATP synthase subunit a n=1 Tax=Acanthormius sp. QL-2013 TaxID=1421592 RepID=A0A0A6ZKV9_9HYME|nr:ATP synthase F0 subunit 6 [Acanthormius sp. QL-2013]
MMLNLFSIFDFSTNLIMSNWISSVICLLMIPQIYWLFKSRIIFFMNNFFFMLFMEFYIIMKLKFNINNMIYFIVLFIFILINNFMGLYSYIFTSTSHLIFSMVFSLSMWMGIVIFGWVKNTEFMLIHLVPQGTPFFLMFFMVLIELLSNLIRPMTLAVRLTANMIAGHLLLTLLASFIPDEFYLYLIILILQLMLLLLEVAVSFIQSYVFIILMILYLKETN